MSTAKAHRSVAVVGAGFSGLVSAYYLAKAGYAVEVFEAKSRPGGLIATLESPSGRVETAANGLLNSALVEDLFADLALPLLTTKKAARKRYIVRDGEARRWPLGVRGTWRVLVFLFNSLFLKARVKPRAQETTRAWAERVLGVEAARYLVETALQGIYAGDATRMSASLIFGRFFTGSNAKPARHPRTRGTVSAPEGMGQLIRALEARLEELGCVFHYGKAFEVDANPKRPTIVATSSRDAAQVLHKHSAEVSRALESIELVPVRHHTDEAGLVGSAHLAPKWIFEAYDSLVAVDIGGSFLPSDRSFDDRFRLSLSTDRESNPARSVEERLHLRRAHARGIAFGDLDSRRCECRARVSGLERSEDRFSDRRRANARLRFERRAGRSHDHSLAPCDSSLYDRAGNDAAASPVC